MSKIAKVEAMEILDSRGNPTVQVEVVLESGVRAIAAVPSGASTGTYEALELRDGDKGRYGGLGVLNAVNNVNKEIAKEIIGMEAEDQIVIDQAMCSLDGTENKSRLGANAILGVSLAVCRAASIESGLPLYRYINQLIKKEFKYKSLKMRLPMPMFNVLNGGQHSDSGLSVQEFKIVPIGIRKFSEQLRAGSEVFHALKKALSSAGQSVGVGDEGGFAPKLESNTQALEFIAKSITDSGYELGKDVSIGLDVAASSFYNEQDDCYVLKPENANLQRDQLIALYRDWMEKFRIVSIEDGLNENDWSGWAAMMEKLRSFEMDWVEKDILQEPMFIGDDLLVTNVKRLKKAIEEKSCNSVLIKVNQIGSLTETIECILLAKKNSMKTVISHRSGETTDDFISDLAVGTGSEFMKSGSLSRGERICKYNRLLKIAEEIK
jgi:enolase